MEILAEDCKKEGNECMKKEKFFEAVLHYTKGIKLDPHNPNIYSNRSLAFLKIQQYYHAIDDAKTVIRILPKWAKGYYRKGEIECAVEHYQEAMATYQEGLTMLPDDQNLQKCLQNATDLWKAQRKAENRMPWFGVALGASIGILLIVGDELVAKNPMLKNDLLRSLVLSGLVTICYGFAVLYRYFLRSQRNSLTEAPIDLMDDNVTSLLTKPVAASKTAAPPKQATSASPNHSRSTQSPTRRKKKD
jgi:tetratricopeptide (TPR) repeat protein